MNYICFLGDYNPTNDDPLKLCQKRFGDIGEERVFHAEKWNRGLFKAAWADFLAINK